MKALPWDAKHLSGLSLRRLVQRSNDKLMTGNTIVFSRVVIIKPVASPNSKMHQGLLPVNALASKRAVRENKKTSKAVLSGTML